MEKGLDFGSRINPFNKKKNGLFIVSFSCMQIADAVNGFNLCKPAM